MRLHERVGREAVESDDRRSSVRRARDAVRRRLRAIEGTRWEQEGGGAVAISP